jgi:predicted dehydrogenase
MTKLRWGLLSTAKINRQLIPALRASERGELAAVASRDLAKAQAYAQEWRIPQAFGSYEALLASNEIDIVYISLPNGLHAEWAVKCLAAGKHVLVEKPFALTVADVDSVIDAAKRTGKVAVEAFMYRHQPQILKIKELVESGALGTISLVRGSFSFFLTNEDDPRLNPAMGGGSLWDVGCYPVSLAQHIYGDKPQEVFAWQQTDSTGIDLTFTGQLRYAQGGLAQIDSGFRALYRTQVEVVGTTGTLTTRPFRPDLNYNGEVALTLNRGDRDEIIYVPNNPLLFAAEVEDLHTAILTGQPPRISLTESRNHVATLVALYQSARSGQPVTLS